MNQPQIAVIGAGVIGRTLARRWTEAGYPVVFGVRSPTTQTSPVSPTASVPPVAPLTRQSGPRMSF